MLGAAILATNSKSIDLSAPVPSITLKLLILISEASAVGLPSDLTNSKKLVIWVPEAIPSVKLKPISVKLTGPSLPISTAVFKSEIKPAVEVSQNISNNDVVGSVSKTPKVLSVYVPATLNTGFIPIKLLVVNVAINGLSFAL